MRVKIGKYVNWFGPYQLAEKICFWAKDVKDEYGFERKPNWVHKFGEWLAHGSIEPDPKPGDTALAWDRNRPETFLYRFLTWIHEKRQRTVSVQIDRWDTWSMDNTLAIIVLPMLKQLRSTKHGAPAVDIKDVPEHLRPSKKELAAYRRNGHTDEQFFARWDWILDEMIFAFEHLVNDDWEEQYHTGKIDLRSQPIEWDENGKPKMYQMVEGPGHTHQSDQAAIDAVNERINRGLLFFGKYYRNLWD